MCCCPRYLAWLVGCRGQPNLVRDTRTNNQGFYNLFLAIGTAAGLGLLGPNEDAGLAVIIFATASMVTAALVLIGSDASKARGAVVQGLFPALSLVAVAVHALG